MKLSSYFSQITPKKIVVIGDFVLDTYTVGKAKRISPEAPVAIVNVLNVDHKPGMVGNVALNLVSLGMNVAVVGRLGADPNGELIKRSLTEEGIDVRGVVTDPRYQTPVKNRIIADNQQMVRIDYEQVVPLPELVEQQVFEQFSLVAADADLIAVSDYGKGFLTRSLLASVIEFAKKRAIPVITDPKGIDFSKYQGSTLIKPNFSEALAVAQLTPDRPIDEIGKRVLEVAGADLLMITRSEAGISLFSKSGPRQDYPVKARQVKDVTGAGDTVLAVLACAMANRLPFEAACPLCNLAAGLAIEVVGCARVTLSDLAKRLLEDDVDNKVFNDDHMFALQQALKGQKVKIFGIDTREGLNSTLFKTLRSLAKKGNEPLLVYLKDKEPNEDIVHLLASLKEVNFIVQSGDGLAKIQGEFDGQRTISMEEAPRS